MLYPLFMAQNSTSCWSIVRSAFPAEKPGAVHMLWSGNTGQATTHAHLSKVERVISGAVSGVIVACFSV